MQTIYPALRYSDASAAIDWLVKAFGFEREFVAPEPNGTIAHAQLRARNDLIMLGSSHDDATKFLSPREAGATTMWMYVRVPEPDLRYRRALDAGAVLVRDIEDTEYGARIFTVDDVEGYRWSFGNYELEPQRDVAISLSYDDVVRAIDWLEAAFGFERKLVVPDGEGGVAHAELRFGDGIIMPASAKQMSKGISRPRELGAVTGTVYSYVADPDAHCRRARAAGARIEREPAETEYGSREYSVRDLDGHQWSFGTYHP